MCEATCWFGLLLSRRGALVLAIYIKKSPLNTYFEFFYKFAHKMHKFVVRTIEEGLSKIRRPCPPSIALFIFPDTLVSSQNSELNKLVEVVFDGYLPCKLLWD